MSLRIGPAGLLEEDVVCGVFPDFHVDRHLVRLDSRQVPVLRVRRGQSLPQRERRLGFAWCRF